MPFQFLRSPPPPVLFPRASSTYICPLGEGLIVTSPEGVIRVDLPGRVATPTPGKLPAGTDEDTEGMDALTSETESRLLTAAQAHLAMTQSWLESYFATPHEPHSLPALKPQGTPFQQTVWRAILAIPVGETATYGELSAAIDRPRASRAVGAACGANPLPLLVPCHRVVGSDGSLTGFGGGLEQKKWLLRHEQSVK